MKKPSSRRVVLLLAAASAACARHSGDVPAFLLGENPIFETRSEIATGSEAHADYHVADFDGDGNLDMAVISVTGELRVLAGNGTAFTLGQQTQIDGLPIWMSGADFDGDGDRDLVIVRSVANSTDLWLNDGNGTFTKGPSLEVGADALAVTVGDFNTDGDPDVAVSRPSAPEIFIGFGDGAGDFAGTQQLALPGGGRAFNLAAGDPTRDGLVDLIVADPDVSRLVIFPGAGNPVDFGTFFMQLNVPGVPGAVTLGDLSGDGQPDMVVSAFDANRYVVITEIFGEDGVGGGSVFNYSSFDVPVPARPSVATVADVTGDGLVDLVGCLAFNASMVIAPQLPGGGVTTQILLDSSGLPLRPSVGPIDNTGRTALFALSGGGNRVNLWLAKPTGELAGARSYLSGLPLASWVEGGDFDGDGDFEVATASYADTRIKIMGKNAEGRLVEEATIDAGSGVFQLEAADLDGDGKTDLVLAVPGGIRVVRNGSTAGNYGFEVLPGSPVTIGSGDFPFGIAVADYDADGDNDIAVCDYIGGGLHVVPGTATAFAFGPETILPLGGGPIDVVAADFTADGRPDLAVSRVGESDIVVLRNDGATFSQLYDVAVGQSPNYLVTADFNRDNRADLVVSNAGTGSVSVLFGTTTGFTAQEFAAGTTPTALLARDLTKDGNPDILVVSLVSGDFRVMVGDGQGSFPLLPTFPGTLGASDAVLQDMDADGRPELMITSLITNRVSVVKNVSVPLVNL